mgnify:CR=1 FL=1|jgi:hypothetical protein
MKDKKTLRKGKVLLKHRRTIYFHWFEFLKFASSNMMNVKWSKYKLWGIQDEIIITKFDDWWEDHQYLFAIEKPGDQPKVKISTTAPKPNAYKRRLKILKVWEKYKNHKQVVEHMNKLKHATGTMGYRIETVDDSKSLLQGARKTLKNVCNGTFP